MPVGKLVGRVFGWNAESYSLLWLTIEDLFSIEAWSDQRRHITWRETGVLRGRSCSFYTYRALMGMELTEKWSDVVSRLQSSQTVRRRGRWWCAMDEEKHLGG